MNCTICDGLLSYLGQLGDTHHGRCINCGMVCTILSEVEGDEE